MAEALVIVIFSISTLLLLALTIYLMVVFAHPEDLGCRSAVGSKLVILLAAVVLCGLATLLPLDLSLGTDPSTTKVLLTLYEVGLLVTLCLIYAIIPMAIVGYEQDPDAPFCGKVVRVVGGGLIFVGLATVLALISWGICKEIPISDLVVVDYGSLVPSSAPVASPTVAGQIVLAGKVTLGTPIFVYLLTAMMLISWFLLVVYLGVGLTSLPLDLVLSWIHRPLPKTAKEIAEKKFGLRLTAEKLIELSHAIQNDRKERAASQEGFFSRWAADRKEKQTTTSLQTQYAALEEEFQIFKLEETYQLNPLWSLLWLLCGILLTVFGVAILLDILLGQVIRVDGRPVAPFLGLFLSYLRRKLAFFAPLLGLVAYGFCLVIFTAKGVTSLGFRFCFFVSLYPLAKNRTLANSLLFNIAIFLHCLPALVHFQVITLGSFLGDTTATTIFGGIFEQLPLLRWFFYSNFFFYLLLVWSCLAAVVSCCQRRSARLDFQQVIRERKMAE